MQKKKSRLLIAVFILFMFTTLVAGCSGGGDVSNDSSVSGSAK